MDNIVLYLRESYEELLHHVTWPTWEELYSSAKLVVVSTILISLLIYLFDSIAQFLLTTVGAL